MFLAFLQVQIVMELDIQISKLNIAAQINYFKKIEEKRRYKHMYKASVFLSFCVSRLLCVPLFSTPCPFLFIFQ